MDIQDRQDGKDDLILTGKTVQWKHWDWNVPGEESGHHEPTWIQTSVDGRRKGKVTEWHPVWPNRILSEANDSLNWSLQGAVLMGIEVVRARGSILAVQLPNAENHYTTIIRFDDDGQLGADYYRVRLTYWKPPRRIHPGKAKAPCPFLPPTPLDPAPIPMVPSAFPRPLDFLF